MSSNTTPRRRRQGQHISEADRPAIQDAFIEAYREGGMIAPAARKAGISRSLIYEWAREDPAFAERFSEAEAIANGVIRDEIWRRGVTGWIETQTTVEVDGDGIETRKTVKTHKYSDAMLRLIAQARMPEFKDRLDVTSGEKQLGAYDAIARIANDPAQADIAADLLNRIAGPSVHAGGPRVDSE